MVHFRTKQANCAGPTGRASIALVFIGEATKSTARTRDDHPMVRSEARETFHGLRIEPLEQCDDEPHSAVDVREVGDRGVRMNVPRRHAQDDRRTPGLTQMESARIGATLDR